MKLILLAFSLLTLLSFNVVAQSDTLVINFKDGKAEKIPISLIQKMKFENITTVNDNGNIGSQLELKGNYPNPFIELTNIEFEISAIGDVEIIIFNNSGNDINKLKCNNCTPGKNIIQWNCLDKNNNPVQSGVYYYEIRFNREILSKKMIVIK